MNKRVVHIIPNWDKREEYMKLAEREQLVFEYNDFFNSDILDSVENTNRLINGYLELDRDRSKDTLHAAFLDVTIHSSDKLIRDISKKRIIQSMEIAKKLGVKGVVVHTNLIPGFENKYYLEQWLEENTIFCRKLLEEYTEQEIYMENMFDREPYMIEKLFRRVNHIRFGVCFDYAHARIFGDSVREWTEVLAPYVKHIHVNDNNKKIDSHDALGEGNTDWKEFRDLMSKNNIESSMLIEVKGEENIQKSIKYLKENELHLI